MLQTEHLLYWQSQLLPGGPPCTALPVTLLPYPPQSLTLVCRRWSRLSTTNPWGFSAQHLLLLLFGCSVMSSSLPPHGLPGSSVHGMSQAWEWVATSFSRGSSQPRGRTFGFCTAGRFFVTETPGKPAQHFTCCLLNCPQIISLHVLPMSNRSLNHVATVSALTSWGFRKHSCCPSQSLHCRHILYHWDTRGACTTLYMLSIKLSPDYLMLHVLPMSNRSLNHVATVSVLTSWAFRKHSCCPSQSHAQGTALSVQKLTDCNIISDIEIVGPLLSIADKVGAPMMSQTMCLQQVGLLGHTPGC